MDIRIERLCKRYGDTVLFQDFTMTLEQGRTYVLTGASGKGKTTLLHMLLGLVQPDSGTVTKNVRYSAVFQENRLLPMQTAIENLNFIAKKGTKKTTLTALLTEILPQDSLEKPIEQLSGGMQRRVAIAGALLAESDCVIMDEPFTGLDEQTVKTVLAFIYRHLNGRTLLLSTHQPEVLQDYPTQRIELADVSCS